MKLFQSIFPLCLLLTALLAGSLPASAGSNGAAPRDVLSLIVSGQPAGHLTECLTHLVWLKENRNVTVGNIFIVDLTTASDSGQTASRADVDAAIAQLDPETRQRLEGLRARVRSSGYRKPPAAAGQQGAVLSEAQIEQYAKQAGVPEETILPADRVWERFPVGNSPTWVVRHKGKDYVLEGFKDISRLFDSDGGFTGESW